MRDILFKSTVMYSNEWVVGNSIIQYEDVPFVYIIKNSKDDCSVHRCYKDTVCEYTGIKDSCGNFIYENDVVRYNYGDYKPNTYQVVYEDGIFMLTNEIERICISDLVKHGKVEHIEVIGNIYDEKDV